MVVLGICIKIVVGCSNFVMMVMALVMIFGSIGFLLSNETVIVKILESFPRFEQSSPFNSSNLVTTLSITERVHKTAASVLVMACILLGLTVAGCLLMYWETPIGNMVYAVALTAICTYIVTSSTYLRASAEKDLKWILRQGLSVSYVGHKTSNESYAPLDELHKTLKCCGVDGYKDFMQIDTMLPLPDKQPMSSDVKGNPWLPPTSCCKHPELVVEGVCATTAEKNVASSAYVSTGCFQALKDKVGLNWMPVVMGFLIVLPLLVNLICVFLLSFRSTFQKIIPIA